MVKLIVVSILLLSCKAFGSPEGAKVLEENLKDIKSITDSSANPCVDFMKYACGNLKDKPENTSLIPYPYRYKTDIDIVKLFLNDDNITSKTALKAKEYFKSCELTKPKDINCYRATMVLFRSVIMSEFYHLYYTEEDYKIDVSIFEQFLKSYEHIKAKFVQPDEYTVRHVNGSHLAMDNIKDKLSRENIENDYKSIEIDLNNFTENTNKLSNLYTGELKVNSDKLNDFYAELIFPHHRSKPLHYHYAAKSFDFWWSFFRHNAPEYNMDQLKECAKNQSEIFKLKLPESMFDLHGLPDQLSGVTQGFRDFETVLKSFENYEEIYKKFELTPEKSFFLTAAQLKCGAKSPEMNEDFYRLLLNMDEFYKSFDCPNKKCFDIL